jgi:hypothetical protein
MDTNRCYYPACKPRKINSLTGSTGTNTRLGFGERIPNYHYLTLYMYQLMTSGGGGGMKGLFGMFFSPYVTVVLVSLSRRKTTKATNCNTLICIKIITVIHISSTAVFRIRDIFVRIWIRIRGFIP